MVLVGLIKMAAGKAKDAMESMRGSPSPPAEARIVGLYVTYGRYDAVCIWEAPDLASANHTMRALAETGLFTTETMVAQTPEDFLK